VTGAALRIAPGIVDAYRSGLTQDEVCRHFGASMWSVRKALTEANALPTKAEARRRRLIATTSPQAIAKRSLALRRPLADRFFSKAIVRSGDQCWGWNGAKDGHGYPQLREGGRNVTATHISLLLHGRPRPDSACALHSCDNPECTNPQHLRWGSQKENIADAIARGRMNLRGLALGRGRK
jgi:hypothetical protein